MKQISSVIGAIALPFVSKLIIPDNISLNTQLLMLISYFLLITAVLAGIFYFRTKDLIKTLIEVKQESKESILKLESKYENEIIQLKDEIRNLENNREGLKNMITSKGEENMQLRSLLSLYAYSHPIERRQELEHAASIHIGGLNHGSESN
ncbi:hypothetical protein FC756_22965 [Lysinibacillus mangiferihumi]|uniref:Uncharacterized protein n=1 Tax=Lysinibacillus mangiferihumi TaxID=1130819 RepID=A0A4V5TQP3_9BACI|nr:hypothetical protein [Lysinibacillus mangiferihumi]TKI53613.1 hypothetical protein FC756_22965 [Lysinibacillus mangiferihumi]